MYKGTVEHSDFSGYIFSQHITLLFQEVKFSSDRFDTNVLVTEKRTMYQNHGTMSSHERGITKNKKTAVVRIWHNRVMVA